MEWVKLFVESYVQLIGHVAWPVAIMTVLFIFRKPIVDKLRRLTKASMDGMSLEFADIAGIQEKLKLSEVTEENLNWGHYLRALEALSGWLSFYLLERIFRYKSGDGDERTLKSLKKAAHHCNDIVNKVRKYRPDSKHLEIIEGYRDSVTAELAKLGEWP